MSATINVVEYDSPSQLTMLLKDQRSRDPSTVSMHCSGCRNLGLILRQ